MGKHNRRKADERDMPSSPDSVDRFVEWHALVAGQGCPLCPPRRGQERHLRKIATLSVSTLYLDRNQEYTGRTVLVFDPRHVSSLEKLTLDEYVSLMTDLRRASLAVCRSTEADHMNYASLGNTIPHVHWHIIPRYLGDRRWGNPVWMNTPEEQPYRALPDAECDRLVDRIRQDLEGSSDT